MQLSKTFGVPFIDRAIAVRPEDGNAHYTKACAHALLGQHEEAIESVRRAIEVAPQLRLFIAMDDDFASIADDPAFLAATKRWSAPSFRADEVHDARGLPLVPPAYNTGGTWPPGVLPLRALGRRSALLHPEADRTASQA